MKRTLGRTTAICRSRKMRRGKQRRFAVRGKCVRASNGVLPFEENAFGRVTAFRRFKKMRLDVQRHSAVRGKRVRMGNGDLPFGENAAEYEVRAKMR